MAKKEKKLGIEKLKSGKFAVVNYEKKVTGLVHNDTGHAKQLTNKEQKLFDETGQFPVGIKRELENSIVSIFNSHAEAKRFISKGIDRTTYQRGIFRSTAQAVKARKIAQKIQEMSSKEAEICGDSES